MARAAPGGKRLSVLNDEFTVRERDGRSESRRIASSEELLTMLSENFGLHFAPGTRFALPGAL